MALLKPIAACAALAWATLAFNGAASAHVSVQPPAAPAGGYQVLRFGVGHGCAGKATTALRIEVPAGVASANPQPKPGWALTIDHAADGKVSAITWRGELAADQFDEFLVHAKLPAGGGKLAFPASQSCGAETVRWDGGSEGHPAPTLLLTDGMIEASAARPAAASSAARPAGVELKDGVFFAGGRALYTFTFDTMVGMSHCEGDCAKMWPPFQAMAGARPAGDWTLVPRADGSRQWAYKTKPLYAYSGDKPGAAPAGEQFPQWRLARPGGASQ
jgi:predicted lipoprotein with Yx(FWY)xxD motif